MACSVIGAGGSKTSSVNGERYQRRNSENTQLEHIQFCWAHDQVNSAHLVQDQCICEKRLKGILICENFT